MQKAENTKTMCKKYANAAKLEKNMQCGEEDKMCKLSEAMKNEDICREEEVPQDGKL